MSVEAAPVCYRHTDRESHIRCQRCERPICPDCMRSAAVGFQCPECVREGQRTGRTGRPLSLAARGVPVVTYALIGINALVWLAVLATPSLVYVLAQHVQNYCTVGDLIAVGSPQSACAAAHGTYVLGTAHGGWWELLTAMFTHQAVWHIASNMLSLYMIGPLLEEVLGRAKYLAAYLVCGFGASLLVMAVGPQSNFTLGASGAIFGLMGILFVLFLRHGLPMQQLVTVLVLNLFITFSVSGISWQGHIGGLITGLAIGSLFAYTPLGRRN